MAIQKRFPVQHADVFPAGAWLVGAVEPVSDFNAPARPDGSRPQQLDKDSGLPPWSVPVLDADEQAGKRDKTITVKIAATHQLVPPSNDTPFPVHRHRVRRADRPAVGRRLGQPAPHRLVVQG